MENFAAVVNDLRFNPAEVDRELERAKAAVRKHIDVIKQLNQGVIPTQELRDIAASFNLG